ncbi:Protein BZZ1 [Microbotryomycetes sp. JL221]|nr:Protein BZZ1 [Microbotryomycetes sp. JL221]
MTLSYGASLPDSELLVNSNAEALIALLPSFADFLATRSSLEREYSRKLSEAAGKARVQANKDAMARFGPDSTLDQAFSKVLELCDVDAREHATLADNLDKLVVNPLKAAGAKLETVRKKHHNFAAKLLSERDDTYAERDKARSKYFEACEAVESARQKKASASDRHADKAERVYQSAHEEMERQKDQFLIDTDRCNVAKRRLYEVDLPAVHDDFQMLSASTVKQFAHLTTTFCTVQRESLTRLQRSVDQAEQVTSTIDVDRDQLAFVSSHSASKLASWELPADLHFEECPVWHDTDDMSVTPPSVVYLQNLKTKAQSRIAEVSAAIDSKRRELGGLRNLRDAYDKDRKLGDTVTLLEQYFDIQHEVTMLEIASTECKAQVELIDAALGEQSTVELRPHEFKSSSFVTPQTCAVCASSVWGKGMSCKTCQLPIHVKCELKAPANCSGVAGGGVSRSHSKRHSHSSNTSTAAPSTAAASSTGPPRRSVPPSFSSSRSSISTSRSSTTTSTGVSAATTTESTATLLYDYAAATPAELTVTAGDVVTVIEPEDEAGWVKVRLNGQTGLVPGSYMQSGGTSSASMGGTRGGGGSGTALYAYEAQSGDELSFSQGDVLNLTALGMDAGQGWAQVRNSLGQVGLVPISYLQT